MSVAARCALLALLLLVAAPAAPVPSSLRSERDAADLADTFMRNMVANDVKGAFGLAAQYFSRGAAELTGRVEQTQERRRDLRKTLGLSLGYELVASEAAGGRILRISHLERFDKGALVWRFLFYRADSAWQLVDLTDTDDPRVLFGAP